MHSLTYAFVSCFILGGNYGNILTGKVLTARVCDTAISSLGSALTDTGIDRVRPLTAFSAQMTTRTYSAIASYLYEENIKDAGYTLCAEYSSCGMPHKEYTVGQF